MQNWDANPNGGHKNEDGWDKGVNSNTEDKIMENNEAERKREIKVRDHEGRLMELSDLLKHNNIYIIS